MVIRFTNAFATGVAALALVLGSGALLTGCKSNDAAPAKSEAAPAPAKAEPAKPAAPKGAAAPASSKLSKVTNNMSPEQVQEVMGSPSGQASYPSAKTFNPYNFGNDSGNRVEYKYKGQGRVVFAVPKYGGNMKVVRVDYDPAEDGN
jgi:outer membrane protein assembly factor BamE (lipoprotein component of BamABCDE complex)